GAGATSKSFAWINANDPDDPTYVALRLASISEYGALDNRISRAIRLKWGGTLASDEAPDQLEARAKALTDLGHNAQIVGANVIAELEPGLRQRPAIAFYCENEGAVDPVAAARTFAEVAAEHGAAVIEGCAVLGLEMAGDSVTGVSTTTGPIFSDAVVLASGIHTARLAEAVGVNVPMSNRFGALMHTRPLLSVINRVVLLDGLHMHQRPDGTVIAGPDFTGALAETSSDGSPIESDNGKSVRPTAVAQSLRDALERSVALTEPVKVARATYGERPVPADGRPIVGRVHERPGLYLAVMHSGVTLAPIIGALAASELSSGSDAQLLSPYRISRFASP
ncbi:MAG: FAD-dependent oxidoreductase, partial [Pseudomonadota bacterium]